jgi:hypothetical protein
VLVYIDISKWTTEDVVAWAREKIPDLMDDDVAVLKSQRVSGPALIGLTYGIDYAFSYLFIHYNTCTKH